MGQYYYLIAGLPELQLDDQKLKITLSEFKIELESRVNKVDRDVLRYFFMQFDNENLMNLLSKGEAELNPLGDISLDDWTDILILFKETDSPKHPAIIEYVKEFVPGFLAEQKVYPELSWIDQLASLYFNYALKCKNRFVAEWFEFNLNVTNVLTAVTCAKHGYDKLKAIIGNNQVAEIIRQSNARDFGVTAEFPEVEEIMKITEEPDIYERERKIDLMKWNWLEEKGFFHYFDVEHLFVYLVRLQLLTRWVKLERETGKKIFREMIAQLQNSFEFPNEFTVKKVAN